MGSVFRPPKPPAPPPAPAPTQAEVSQVTAKQKFLKSQRLAWMDMIQEKQKREEDQ